MKTETQQTEVIVKSVRDMPGNVYRIELQVPGSQEPLHWHAGQYLELVMPDGRARAYSIASAPGDGRSIELHIQCYANHEKACEVVEYLSSVGEVTINIPKGNCLLESCPDRPVVFIAAGTGFAQMKAMLEQCFEERRFQHVGKSAQKVPPLFLYWGVRRAEGFYMAELARQWAEQGLLEFHPVVSERGPDDDWHGRHGLLYQAVLDDSKRFPDAVFYISGSPEMVYATVDGLTAAGVAESDIHSDVFDYAPRKSE